MIRYISRLLPAANAAAFVAALAHVIGIAIASRHVGLELVYLAVVTYIVALVCALPCGAILLAIVNALKLGPISALVLFLVVAQTITIGLAMIFFEAPLKDLPWQYALISIPAPVAAWYYSVRHIWRRETPPNASP